VEVDARENREDAKSQESLGHLVQTTTPEDEYRGLVHLGLLQAQVNDSGDLSQSIRNVLPTVVQVQTGNLLGSGIILEMREEEVLVASNRHQLGGQEFSVIRFYNGAQVSGRLIYLSQTYDLGFALADISSLPYEERARLRAVTMEGACERGLCRGKEMFLVGSTDGVACNIYEGTIADPLYYFEEFGSYMIYSHCFAKAGMSGGGTYDGHGHCIGMITGGYESDTASLPADNIREEWEKMKGK